MTFPSLLPLSLVGGPLAAGAVRQVGETLQSFGEFLSGGTSIETPPAAAAAPKIPFDQLLAEAGEEPTQAALRSEAQSALASLQQTFTSRLAEAGIDLSQPIELSLRDGRFRVEGHPQADQIEAILNGDEELGADAERLREVFTVLNESAPDTGGLKEDLTSRRLQFTLEAGQLRGGFA
ncbi:hypothetical protein [Lignipirellula cremea]|uniref:Uncharacterized protein n=1 Tax=Lignipirellula cremea TaxID=2528010 RepID=A0A518E362_9BACT|nr:hypothetical protein [Lignipirellula cremea]QDU98528.1 hypothetical protein Pla8534_63970 [Lignipirellula cremea]